MISKLRWKKSYDKVWADWVHDDGTKDGGYRYIETGEKVLQYLDDTTWLWEDVPDEGIDDQ